MASRRKPWVAKRKRDGVSHYLGYYWTQEEALDAELAFGKAHPPRTRRVKNGR